MIKLDGFASFLLKNSNTKFKRELNGVYAPYQKNINFFVKQQDCVKQTKNYFYVGMLYCDEACRFIYIFELNLE